MAVAPMVNLKLFLPHTFTFILEGENLKESEEDHKVFCSTSLKGSEMFLRLSFTTDRSLISAMKLKELILFYSLNGFQSLS